MVELVERMKVRTLLPRRTRPAQAQDLDGMVLPWLVDQLKNSNLSESELDGRADALLSKVTDAASKHLLKTLDRTTRSMLRQRRSAFRGFEKRLYSVWREALDRLEAMVELAHEAGSSFSVEKVSNKPTEGEYLSFVLAHMHARGCQVASEVLTLLKCGFADGAHARWRTLHELNVIAQFLAKHGENAARRYMRHAAVESYEESKAYQKHYRALGYEPLSQIELDRLRSKYESAITEFGPEFGRPYGWAASVLGKSAPTFRDIEKAAEQGLMRPLYKWACANVHASPKRIGFSLGYAGLDILPAGPSDMGLADPGTSTASTLSQLTATLLVQHPTVERICTLKVLQAMAERTGQSFLSVHSRFPKLNG